MTFTSFKTFRDAAIEARSRDTLQDAANHYTMAAYEALGASDYLSVPLAASGSSLGAGLYCLLWAGFCYRSTNQSNRCRNRCTQGRLVCEDVADYVADSDAHRGLMSEFAGDFLLLCDDDTWRDSYATARSYYSSVPNPESWVAEPEFD